MIQKFKVGDLAVTTDGFKVRIVSIGWDEDLNCWYECEPVDFQSFTREFPEESLMPF